MKRSIRCAFVFVHCASFLLLSGCVHDRVVEQSPILSHPPPNAAISASSETRYAQPQTEIIGAPPLRRTPDTILGPTESMSALIVAENRAAPAFSALKVDGQVIIRTAGSLAQADIELLESLGFKPDQINKSEYVRYMPQADRAAFEKDLSGRISASEAEVNESRSRLEASRRPLKGSPGMAAPGRIVYTGQPLDIALADHGERPSLFIKAQDPAGTTQYSRGGRAYVSEEWDLKLDQLKLIAEKIPQDAVQVIIQSDGRVSVTRSSGGTSDIARLELVRVADPDNISVVNGSGIVRPGHLEFPDIDTSAEAQRIARAIGRRRAVEVLQTALVEAVSKPLAGAAEPKIQGALTIHADLVWTEEHLKALGVQVERAPGRTMVPLGHDPNAVAAALVKVLDVLRLRMAIHEQNLRNADKIRDADNRLNPYQRKILKIGPQGEPVEGLDPAPFPKTYKPGDPNADAQGYILLPNVNRAVENAEFHSAEEEYKLVRSALERLAPQEIFPDPISLP